MSSNFVIGSIRGKELFFALALMLTIPTIIYHIRINLASRQAYTTLSVPANHPRHHIWSALQQTGAGNHTAAISILQPHTAAGDRLAAQLTARVHEQTGNYAAAVAIWQQHRDAESLQRVATAALQNDALEDARFAFEAQWRVHPVLGTNRYASFLEREMGDFSAAAAILRESMETYPASPRYPYWASALAANLVHQEKWSESVHAYEQWQASAGRISPGDRNAIPRTYADMAWALHMAGRHDDALTTIERALAAPPDGYVFRVAGRLYEETNMLDEAITVYERWLDADPAAEAALAALHRLREYTE